MNNNQTKKSSIVNKVLEQIKSGKVKMKPKIYFILKTVLVLLAIVVAALFALYLISLIHFSLRASGAWYLPGFGLRGMRTLFFALPWLLISTAILLIVVLEVLVKRFSFSYRRPILYSTIAIIVVVLLGGLVLSKTSLHPNLLRRAREGRFPVVREVYSNFAMPRLHNVHRGTVVEIIDNGFLVEDTAGEILTVKITPETRLPFEQKIEKDDLVMVMGERDNDTVKALGIRKVNDDFRMPPPVGHLRRPWER